jgi:hypothetical protein
MRLSHAWGAARWVLAHPGPRDFDIPILSVQPSGGGSGRERGGNATSAEAYSCCELQRGQAIAKRQFGSKATELGPPAGPRYAMTSFSAHFGVLQTTCMYQWAIPHLGAEPSTRRQR